jgi:hypothetical protein
LCFESELKGAKDDFFSITAPSIFIDNNGCSAGIVTYGTRRWGAGRAMTWTLVGKGRVIEGPSWERGRIVEYEGMPWDSCEWEGRGEAGEQWSMLSR